MAYFEQSQLEEIGFKYIGKNVKISDKAAIYNPEMISIGDNSRIDDFCVISGNIKIGRNVHVTPQCLLAGGLRGLVIGDFATLAYGVKVFTQSDDYSGATMTNSTVPKIYKNELIDTVHIKDYSIIGAGSVIMPGVVIEEGGSIGANSLVLKTTQPWSIYVGSPCRKINERKKDLLELAKKYLETEK